MRDRDNRTTQSRVSLYTATDSVSRWTNSRRARKGKDGRKSIKQTLVMSGSPTVCISAWATSQTCLLLLKHKQSGIQTARGTTAKWRRRVSLKHMMLNQALLPVVARVFELSVSSIIWHEREKKRKVRSKSTLLLRSKGTTTSWKSMHKMEHSGPKSSSNMSVNRSMAPRISAKLKLEKWMSDKASYRSLCRPRRRIWPWV